MVTEGLMFTDLTGTARYFFPLCSSSIAYGFDSTGPVTGPSDDNPLPMTTKTAAREPK